MYQGRLKHLRTHLDAEVAQQERTPIKQDKHSARIVPQENLKTIRAFTVVQYALKVDLITVFASELAQFAMQDNIKTRKAQKNARIAPTAPIALPVRVVAQNALCQRIDGRETLPVAEIARSLCSPMRLEVQLVQRIARAAQAAGNLTGLDV